MDILNQGEVKEINRRRTLNKLNEANLCRKNSFKSWCKMYPALLRELTKSTAAEIGFFGKVLVKFYLGAYCNLKPDDLYSYFLQK